MAGNSLGLLPKEARLLINQELDVWGSRSVTLPESCSPVDTD